jgi:uncharacterized protein Yka (UPF0111/DUF47 family)
MNIDSILKFFVPKDDSFFPLFEDNAQVLIKAAGQLKLFIASEEPELRARIEGIINELAKTGDEVALKTYAQLNKSFVTPFEREDILQLACNLNDVVDSIYHIAKSISIYRPAKMDILYSDLAEIIYQATVSIDFCLNYLRYAGSNKQLILKSCSDVRLLEQKGKEKFYSGIESMLEKERSITELIKNKEILEYFERCIYLTGSVSSTLKTILLTIQ